MEEQQEHHRLYHGTLKPLDELDLPVNAVRRQTLTSSASSVSSSARHSSRDGVAKVGPISAEQLEKEQKHCHWCQLAKFSTHDTYPIGIVNDVNDETLPADFQFTENSILCRGVTAADEGFRTGCECQSDGRCMLMSCDCLQELDFHGTNPGKRTLVYAYNPSGRNKDCLRFEILNSRDPIYECHEKCKCSLDCNNRVVERGRKIPLEIFRTSDGRGWGVRATANIFQGQFIDTYVGEIITPKESARRREASDIASRKDVYLFALDKFSNPESMDPRLAGAPFEVDGEFKSGPTRFINHSCDPNMRIFARVGDHADKHIHDLALFAITDIRAGEELTFDYIDGKEEGMNWERLDPDQRADMTKCLCGSEHCRGFLW